MVLFHTANKLFNLGTLKPPRHTTCLDHIIILLIIKGGAMMAEQNEAAPVHQASEKEKPICGIVMPISGMGDLPTRYWRDVRSIIDDAANLAGFTPKLVSDAEESGIIQKHIVENLYQTLWPSVIPAT